MNLLMILIVNRVMVADSLWSVLLQRYEIIVSGKNVGTWKCTAKCKALKQLEVYAVLKFSLILKVSKFS